MLLPQLRAACGFLMLLHLEKFAYNADKRPADLTDKVQRRA